MKNRKKLLIFLKNSMLKSINCEKENYDHISGVSKNQRKVQYLELSLIRKNK